MGRLKDNSTGNESITYKLLLDTKADRTKGKKRKVKIMKMNKMISFLLCMVMLVTMLAGCGSSGGDDSGQSSDGSREVQTNVEGEERMVLQIYVDEDVIWSEKAEILQELENQFQVTFEPIRRPSMDQADWYTLKLTGGDSFDYIVSGGLHFNEYESFVSQGLVAEISREMVEENMPNLTAWIKKYSDSWIGDIYSYYDIEGKIYGIPQARPDDAYRNVLGLRKDWLEKLNLQVPETIEDMEEVLRAFVTQDPDGNGVDDTYGYTATSWTAFSLSPFFGAYGVYPGNWYEKDGELILGKLDGEGMKQALEVLADWYAQGLIDPELLIQSDFAEVKNKVCSSKAGATTMYYGDLLFPDNGWYYSDLLKINPEAEWEVISGLNGGGCLQFNPLNYAGIMFGDHMAEQPEKMKKYMQVFDALMEMDQRIAITWGIEGKTFEMQEDGARVWLAPYDKAGEDESIATELAETYGIGTYGGVQKAFQFMTEFCSDPEQTRQLIYSTDKAQLDKKGSETAFGVYDIMSPYTSKNESNKVYSEALNTLYATYLADIIMGSRPVSDYDKFLEEFYAQGGKEIVEEQRELYKNYFK